METPAETLEVDNQQPESVQEETQDTDVQPPKIQYNQVSETEDINQDENIQKDIVPSEIEEQKPEEAADETLEPIPQVKEEKAQTLDALLNDLNMNGKKQNDEDPFEFLGSLDDF